MECPNCSSNVNEEAFYCSKCGTQLIRPNNLISNIPKEYWVNIVIIGTFLLSIVHLGLVFSVIVFMIWKSYNLPFARKLLKYGFITWGVFNVLTTLYQFSTTLFGPHSFVITHHVPLLIYLSVVIIFISKLLRVKMPTTNLIEREYKMGMGLVIFGCIAPFFIITRFIIPGLYFVVSYSNIIYLLFLIPTVIGINILLGNILQLSNRQNTVQS